MKRGKVMEFQEKHKGHENRLGQNSAPKGEEEKQGEKKNQGKEETAGVAF